MTLAPQWNEKELLVKLREGDEMAFNEVYRMFQPALVFFAKRILFSQQLHEAEEVAQDSLMKFYERRHNFETIHQVKSFLYTATKNSCLQHLEKEKVRTKRYEKFMLQFEEQEDVILNEIIYTEAVRQLRLEIEKLPPKCRQIMKKLIWEDKNANEVANELNISVSTVNNQKSRAVSLLRKKLSDTGLLFLLLHL